MPEKDGEFLNYIFSKQHSSKLQVFVRSTGEFNLFHIDQYSMHREAGFSELFWVCDGAGFFHYMGRKVRVSPGQIWYYPVGSDHFYYPCGDHFHYFWLTLQGTTPDLLFKMLSIAPGMSQAGPCPVELFQRLATEISGLEASDSAAMLATAFRILSLAAVHPGGKMNKTDYVDSVKMVIDDDFANRQLTVESLATSFRVHRVVLSRSFSARYKVGICEYMRRRRVSAAIGLLEETDLPAAEIAGRCGFSSPEYFSRVIREATGHPPARYRLLHAAKKG
ncbi:MAG: AraC family transcriptional regulator [Victivallaceae bacterium]|nr:AraC family transcriptional regulator [Victivallaceae bacterium]